jgi:hypothetical protein
LHSFALFAISLVSVVYKVRLFIKPQRAQRSAKERKE